jgi:hypothetical protein
VKNKAEKIIRSIALILLILSGVAAIWYVNYGLPLARGEPVASTSMSSIYIEFWENIFYLLLPFFGFIGGILAFAIHKSGKSTDSKLDALINTRGSTGGLAKRIDENREIMQLIYAQAPELVSSHPWLESWLKANDTFFIQLADIVPLERKHHIRDLPVFNH